MYLRRCIPINRIHKKIVFLSNSYDITAKICRTKKFGRCTGGLRFRLVTAHPDNLPDLSGAIGPIHGEGFPALGRETPDKAGGVDRILKAADLDGEIGTAILRRRR